MDGEGHSMLSGRYRAAAIADPVFAQHRSATDRGPCVRSRRERRHVYRKRRADARRSGRMKCAARPMRAHGDGWFDKDQESAAPPCIASVTSRA